MSKIGEYRLKIYELLFRIPICEYVETVGNNKEINVLILGNGWAGNEAFKASFWAGQYPNCKLKITVASKTASTYKKQLMSTLPSLSLFAEQKGYAELSFKDIMVNNNNADFSLLDTENSKYNYVVVALGSGEHNWLAAMELISRIGDAKRKGSVSYNGKIVINVFNERLDEISDEDREYLVDEGKQSGIEVYFFGDKSEVTSDLDRIARNINFAYEMKYNQRASKIESDQKFKISKELEFVQSPHDYEVDDWKLVSNFVGSEYTADSSYASAVHIPYKLAVCREYDSHREAIDVLKQAIKSKNGLFKKLVSFEHRRWNAYMVTRGYRAPTKTEEENTLYHGNNTHQDKNSLIHICLCECGDRGPILGDKFNMYYKQWIAGKCPKNSLSELDCASLRCHQLTSGLTNKMELEDVLKNIIGDNIEYINYRKSIKKLFNDEDNSLVVYDHALNDAMMYAKSISEDEVGSIRAVDKSLNVVKIRNRRLDFLSLDCQLVEMIPFSLWYDNKYKTVVTISDGQAVNDVVVPTLLSASEAIFIGSKVDDEKYKSSVVSFFENRGSVTKPLFIKNALSSVQDVVDAIVAMVSENCGQSMDDVVFNFVPHRREEVGLVYGVLLEKYKGKINIIRYNTSRGGIVSFAGDKDVGVGLESKSLSVDEYVNLMGGKITNEFNALYDSKQYVSLRQLFRTYSGTRYYNDDNNVLKSFIPWNDVSFFFLKCAKIDDSFDNRFSKGKDYEEGVCYAGRFSLHIYECCRIGVFLKDLQNYHIISNFKESHQEEFVDVECYYYNQGFDDLLLPFEAKTLSSECDTFIAEHKQLRFVPFSGIRVTNLYEKGQKLYDNDDPQIVIDSKTSLLERLQHMDFIYGLSFDEEGKATFAFKDEPTMNLLKKQGNTFELLLYDMIRETGIFDDIETGTEIVWDMSGAETDNKLLSYLSSERNSTYGYRHYSDIRKKLLYSTAQTTSGNELDVIAMNGMTPVFISCKTGKGYKIEWLYEINSLASHFKAASVIAISSSVKEAPKDAFYLRAREMGVSVLDADTIWNESKLVSALKTIADGKYYDCMS